MKVAGKIFVMLVILALILVPLAACEGEETAGVTAITVPAGEPGATGEQGPAGPPGRAGEEGAQGEQGPAGEDGATWYTGAGAPAAATGVSGDLYLNTVNGDVYKKGTSAWTKITNITGPAGARGATGSTGASGPPGTTVIPCPFYLDCYLITLGGDYDDDLIVNATSVFNAMVYLQDGLDVDGTAEFDGNVVIGDNSPSTCSDTLTVNATAYFQCDVDVDGTTDLDGALYVDGNITLGDTVCGDTLTVNANANFYCDVTVYDAAAHLNIEADDGTLIIGQDVLNATPDVRFKVDGPTGSLFIGNDVLATPTPDIRFSVDGGTGETTVMGPLHPEGDIEKTGTGATNDLIITASGATANSVELATGTLIGPPTVQLEAGNDDGLGNDFVATYGYLDPQADILKTTGALDIATSSGAITISPSTNTELTIDDSAAHEVTVAHDLEVTDDIFIVNGDIYKTKTGADTNDYDLYIETDSSGGDEIKLAPQGIVELTVHHGSGLVTVTNDLDVGGITTLTGVLHPNGNILKSTTTGNLLIETADNGQAIVLKPGGSTELTIDDSAANEVTVEHNLQVKGLTDLVGQVSIGTAGLDMSGHIDLNGNNLIAGGTLNANYVLVNGYNAVTHPTLSGQMIQGKTVVGLNPYDPYNLGGGGATPALTATFNFPTMVDSAVVSCTADANAPAIGWPFDGVVPVIKSIVGNTVTIDVYVEGEWPAGGGVGHLMEITNWFGGPYNLSGITFYVIATGH